MVRVGSALTMDCCSKYSKMGNLMRQSYELFFEWLNQVRGGLRVRVAAPVEAIVVVGVDAAVAVGRAAGDAGEARAGV